MNLSPATIAALWELRDHIDDPFVYGDLTGWLECQEGTPPYSPPLAADLPQEPRNAPDATPTAEPATNRTDAHIEHGDTWTIRDGRQVIITSHRWPPPKPGTHESDTFHICPCGGYDKAVLPWQSFEQHAVEADTAEVWSRAHATKEAQ